MARETGGFRFYLLDAGRIRSQATLELVETFGPAGETEVVTVEGQRAHAAAILDGQRP